MSASSRPRSNSFAAADRGPSWPEVVRIFARQRLMPLSDFLGSAVGAALVLLAQSPCQDRICDLRRAIP